MYYQNVKRLSNGEKKTEDSIKVYPEVDNLITIQDN